VIVLSVPKSARIERSQKVVKNPKGTILEIFSQEMK